MKRTLIPVILSMVVLLPFVSADIDHRWEAHEVDSNPMNEPLITYQEKNVLYQDGSLKFFISNTTYPDGIYKLKIINGTFDGDFDPDRYYRSYDYYGEYYRDWGEGYEDEIISENPHLMGFELGFILWPSILDEDFWVEMELTVVHSGQEVYEEHHRIFVVGQPMIIEGSEIDITNEVIGTYSIAMGGSILFWGAIALIVFLARKGNKEAGN